VTTTTEPITRDDEAWWVRDPRLADRLIHDPRITARRALEPWSPLRGQAAQVWAGFQDSAAGRQAASSVLATDGHRHHQLSEPVTGFLNRIPGDARFDHATTGVAGVVADALAATPAPADLAPLAGQLPASTCVRWFGLPMTGAELEDSAQRQTGLLWARRYTEADQLAAMAAAWRLRQACESAVADPPPHTMAAWLTEHRMPPADAVGLLYGVSIPWVMGVKYGILNTVWQLLTDGGWGPLGRALAEHQAWRAPTPAVRAALRARPPVVMIGRSAGHDITLPDYRVTIRAGQRVVFDVPALNTAGRDDWTFGVPERHFCSGNRIARSQVAAAVGVLARRFPHARLAEPDPPLIDSRFHHGPARLLITL
jgi:cytochrome P450